MKTFACGDVIPGCGARFSAADEDGIFAQVAGHADSILQCGVCGRMESPTTCSPLLVGGEVIGAVLAAHPAALDPFASRAIDESVKQAAPLLANLRNLAIAENRAATDGLRFTA